MDAIACLKVRAFCAQVQSERASTRGEAGEKHLFPLLLRNDTSQAAQRNRSEGCRCLKSRLMPRTDDKTKRKQDTRESLGDVHSTREQAAHTRQSFPPQMRRAAMMVCTARHSTAAASRGRRAWLGVVAVCTARSPGSALYGYILGVSVDVPSAADTGTTGGSPRATERVVQSTPERRPRPSGCSVVALYGGCKRSQRLRAWRRSIPPMHHP